MKQLLNGFVLFIVSILLGIIVLPIGFIYDIIHSAYKSKIKQFVFRFGRTINAVLKVFGSIFEDLAIGIDEIGNVIAGELIEDCITTEENTTFGNSDITISASTGKLESEGKLNKTGLWFNSMLSKVFGKNHSIDAYKRWVRSNLPI